MRAEDYLRGHWYKKEIWTHLERPKHQIRLRRCAELAASGLGAKPSIADVGCGIGHSTHIMKEFLPGDWHGIEFWRDAVNRARNLWPEHILKFHYADPDTMDLAGDIGRTFDAVICSEVIEHVEKPVLLVNGLLGLAEKRVVITTPNRFVSDPGHLRLYTREKLDILMQKCGVDNYRILSETVFFYVVIEK